jgi:hypothetical protein
MESNCFVSTSQAIVISSTRRGNSEEAYQVFAGWQPTHGAYLVALNVFRKLFFGERRSLEGHLKRAIPSMALQVRYSRPQWWIHKAEH